MGWGLPALRGFQSGKVQICVEDQLEFAEVVTLEDRIFSAERADFIHSGAGDRPVGTQSWH